MEKTPMKTKRQQREGRDIKRPMVAVPPPLIFGVFLGVGLGLQWLFPLRFLSCGLGLVLGMLCMLPALVLLATARAAFRRSRNSMRYTGHTRALITEGPYRYTRNPLFVGLLLVYIGSCLAVGVSWPLIFLPLIVALLQWIVIIPEERFLEDRFGDVYRVYKAHVRRWL